MISQRIPAFAAFAVMPAGQIRTTGNPFGMPKAGPQKAQINIGQSATRISPTTPLSQTQPPQSVSPLTPPVQQPPTTQPVTTQPPTNQPVVAPQTQLIFGIDPSTIPWVPIAIGGAAVVALIAVVVVMNSHPAAPPPPPARRSSRSSRTASQ